MIRRHNRTLRWMLMVGDAVVALDRLPAAVADELVTTRAGVLSVLCVACGDARGVRSYEPGVYKGADGRWHGRVTVGFRDARVVDARDRREMRIDRVPADVAVDAVAYVARPAL